jgi:cytochrome P450
MASYLERFDATSDVERWPAVQRWMFEEPLPFFAELRSHRPILVTPAATLVARFADCREILLRHDAFSVALYKPKQGDYWMAQDDTPVHWREKSIMRAVLDREQIPDIRRFIADRSAALLNNAGGTIEAVGGLTRAVPIALVQEWFGFVDADPKEMFEWSFWNQYDAFHNQPFDADPRSAEIIAKREAGNARMRDYLVALVQRRAGELRGGAKNTDVVSRLLILAASGALKFDPARVILNVGGLLIGAVETTSQAVIHSLAELLARPEILAEAQAAAALDAPEAFDGYAFEALRFRPISPYMFRVCETDTRLASGTDHVATVRKGTTVLPLVHSAMFDEAAFPNPDRFDPGRPLGNTFHLGLGLHECLGRAIAQVMIPEIVRQCLRLPAIAAEGPVDQAGGPFPERFVLRWQTAPCAAAA